MNYQSIKTVKLSDAYVVEIKDIGTNGELKKFGIDGAYDGSVLDNPSGLVDCYLNNAINVKIPSVKSTADQLKYNTFGHSFVRIDLDSAPDTLEITLYETSDEKVKKLVNYLLEKNGYNEKSYGYFDPFNTLKSLNVYVLNNNLTKSVFAYEFEGLKLINYDYGYGYDYKDSTLPTITLSFTYRGFSYGVNNSLKFESTKAAMEAEKKAVEYKPNTTQNQQHGGKYR